MSQTVSTAFIDALVRLGVTHAFGVMGGAIAPFFKAVSQSNIKYAHLRHEAGCAFAATEASLATKRPVLVFTTSGPGISNALTGLLAARWEGAQVILVSAGTSAAQRGRVATQETRPADVGGEAFHVATTLEHPAQLGPIVNELATGLGRAGGFVAHVNLPIEMQMAPAAPVRLVARNAGAPMCSPDVIRRHAAMLANHSLAIWVGFGARHAAAEIRQLAEATDARVMCTPRAKGVFPEHHRQFLGVTGVGGHPDVDAMLVEDRPVYTLVLGTRLGESSSFWSPELRPSEAFIHVDVDPSVFGTAYPEAATHGVVADVAQYCAALLAALPPRNATQLHGMRTVARPAPRAHGPVRPQQLFAEIQRVIVDGSDAWVMAESGNSFCWANHLLQFAAPGRYRVSTGWGSMGHAPTGVVGAALARGGKAFALVGDGAMMMLNELHSAVQHNADAVWIVLNDAAYLMCQQGMTAMGWTPFSCEMPRVDFVALARAVGADGERVEREAEVAGALERALAAKGPRVLDVRIDPAELPPSGRRNRSLMQQGYDHGGR